MGVCLSENICGVTVAEQLFAHSTEQHTVSVFIPQFISAIVSDIDDDIIALDSSIISQTPIAETGVIKALNAKMSMSKRAIKNSIRHFRAIRCNYNKFNKIL